MIRIKANAKVNFFLDITGKRADGYHTLSTVFQTISLGDELTIRPAAELSMTCSDPSLPVDERNLVMKAALRLRDALKEKRGAAIHLKKITPMGAGLGGGSADAAATLKALLKLWERRMSGLALHRLAVGLGADVPFFLKGGLAYATGIGDALKPLKPLPKTWMVLVWPGFGVSTKEAYGKVVIPADCKPGSSGVKDAGPRITDFRGDVLNWSSLLFNRFESLVFPDHPELPLLKQEFLDAGATASLMSGSGSSVFGLASSRSHAVKILKTLQPKYKDSFLVHTV